MALFTAVGGLVSASAQNVRLLPADTPEGYVARLLINEAAFPGERGYRSEQDSGAAMLAVLWVLHGRIHHVPEGYTQREVAMIETQSLIEVITADGSKDQVEGFFRDRQGRFRAVPRVHRRVAYLVSIGNQGAPGPVARLLNRAQDLASAYAHRGPEGPDIFENIRRISGTEVTGRSYSWMSAFARRTPGGNFVPIPVDLGGILGGNRFFTLRVAP